MRAAKDQAELEPAVPIATRAEIAASGRPMADREQTFLRDLLRGHSVELEVILALAARRGREVLSGRALALEREHPGGRRTGPLG
jgi:hypothetical protein